jgi:hypothetical protein
MANRIESLMLVDIETLELVSVIYQVLGLPENAKFIVNTGADFRLEWRPYFDAFDESVDSSICRFKSSWLLFQANRLQVSV